MWRLYCYFKDGKLEGECVNYYSDKTIFQKYLYKNGKKKIHGFVVKSNLVFCKNYFFPYNIHYQK